MSLKVTKSHPLYMENKNLCGSILLLAKIEAETRRLQVFIKSIKHKESL